MDKKTKDRILRSLYALDEEKRHKIMQLAAYLSEDDMDDIRYDVMLSYMDSDSTEKLNRDFELMMNSGFAPMYPEEGGDSKVPNRVILKNDEKK